MQTITKVRSCTVRVRFSRDAEVARPQFYIAVEEDDTEESY